MNYYIKRNYLVNLKNYLMQLSNEMNYQKTNTKVKKLVLVKKEN